MFCDCGKQSKGYTAMHEKDEKGRPDPLTFNYDFWVCANCMRPSQMVFMKLTNRYTPKRATHMRSVHGHGDGRTTIRWATEKSGETLTTMVFHAYPRKVDMPGVHDQGRDVCVELWHKLDNTIDQIRGGQVDVQLLEFEKVRASTLADTIALIMSPFYADTNAVLAESMTRWKARQEGREHESPGLAESIWDPLSRFDGTPYSREAEQRARNGGAAAKTRVQFDEQKITFIKHTLENGQMTPEVLAGMFNCTVDDIKAAVE